MISSYLSDSLSKASIILSFLAPSAIAYVMIKCLYKPTVLVATIVFSRLDYATRFLRLNLNKLEAGRRDLDGTSISN